MRSAFFVTAATDARPTTASQAARHAASIERSDPPTAHSPPHLQAATRGHPTIRTGFNQNEGWSRRWSLDVCGTHGIRCLLIADTSPFNLAGHPITLPRAHTQTLAAIHPPPPSPVPRLHPSPSPPSPVVGRGQALAFLAGGAGLYHDRTLLQGLRVRARPERKCVAWC